jgi:hypothetical protein
MALCYGNIVLHVVFSNLQPRSLINLVTVEQLVRSLGATSLCYLFGLRKVKLSMLEWL